MKCLWQVLNFLRRLPLISASNYLLVHQKLVPQVPQTIASDTLVLDVVPQGPQTSASSAPDECLKCPRRVPQVPQVPQTSAPSAPNECPKCPKRVPQVPQKSAPSAPVPQMRNKVVSPRIPICGNRRIDDYSIQHNLRALLVVPPTSVEVVWVSITSGLHLTKLRWRLSDNTMLVFLKFLR